MEKGYIQIKVPIEAEDISDRSRHSVTVGETEEIRMFDEAGNPFPDKTRDVIRVLDKNVLVLNKDALPDFVCGIIELFENFLSERNISVQTSQEKIEEAAEEGYDAGDSVIFGDDYYELESSIIDLLNAGK